MNATRPLAEKLELPLTNATDLVEPSMLGRRLKNHEEYASIRRQRVRNEPVLRAVTDSRRLRAGALISLVSSALEGFGDFSNILIFGAPFRIKPRTRTLLK
jgi:hypothetical protein